jgi:hypothetical protein
MSIYFSGLLQTQRSLGESFSELQRISGSSDDLIDELVRNSQCQKALALNGDSLLSKNKNKKFLFILKIKILFRFNQFIY